ncbi:hypothetical protein [Nocardia fluminea]|uniref:Uncharacterized protein n=1 Tax=Nocardia fluminea TaxID=134984 RepID=A0A2N3V7C1_9NOCA|nr:hypothetical protein [Nocardia fluminea]PKV77514.1 hypothetical protein ATK86_1859 [Nocardia fluminea]
MPHGPDIAAEPLSTRSTSEGAADMARFTTMRHSLDDAVREISTAPLPLPGRPRTARRTESPFPAQRRRGTGSAIRGAQNRAVTVRRPMRIPGR